MKPSGTNTTQGAEQQVQTVLGDASLSWWKKYAYFATGRDSVRVLVAYEMLTALLSGMPGAAGFFLRQKCYRLLMGKLGPRAMIGRHVTLRGASRIQIGNHVFIDDHCVLDARGAEASIVIGDHAILARNTIIRAKGGSIVIGEKTDIGSTCLLTTDSRLQVGREVLLGAYTYLCGGGTHNFSDIHIPILHQGFTKRGGIVVGDGSWIGAHCLVMDGADVGPGTVVGAHSLVNKSLPDFCIAYGVPAQERRSRGAQDEPLPKGSNDAD